MNYSNKATDSDYNSNKRLVALFDILGFADLVRRDAGHVAEVLHNFVTKANEVKSMNSDIGMLGYSDSIVLYTKHWSKDSVLWWDMVNLARGLFIACLAAKIPVRGVITHDTFFNEKSSEGIMDLFWGMALVNANKIEKEIKSVSLCILPDSICSYGFTSAEDLIGSYPNDFKRLTKFITVNPFSRIASLSESISIHDAIRSFDPQIVDEIKAYRFLQAGMDKQHLTDVKEKYCAALESASCFLADKGTSTETRLEEMHKLSAILSLTK